MRNCLWLQFLNFDTFRLAAHRIILSAISPYFRTMFTTSMRESVQKEVELCDVDSESLESLIRYCYTGIVNLSAQTVETLAKCASLFQISPVLTACGSFMANQLDLSNCLGFLGFAETYNCRNLLMRALTFCEENFLSLKDSEEFLISDANTLAILLKSDKIVVHSEEDAFNMLSNWIQYDFINRKQFLSKLLSLIRFQALTPKVNILPLNSEFK